MQGVGVVVPLFATYDSTGPEPGSKLYFYDVMGANFEVAEYAATGSGSPAVRGVLYYENTWGRKPLSEYSLEEALNLTLRALDTAAEADTRHGWGGPPRSHLPDGKDSLPLRASARSRTRRCAAFTTAVGTRPRNHSLCRCPHRVIHAPELAPSPRSHD